MRFADLRLLVAAGLVASSSIACGSSSNEAPPSTPGNDAGAADASGDDGAPAVDSSVGYPAPHQPFPQVNYNGGGLLTGARVVTVTFDGDSLRSTLEGFGDVIIGSPWWDAVRTGYCAGPDCVSKGASPATNPHVRLASVPTHGGGDAGVGALTDVAGAATPGQSDIQDWLRKEAENGDFKDLDEQTLYVVYFPTGTDVTLDQGGGNVVGSCTNGGFGGYHNSVSINLEGGAINLPYAIVPRCKSPGQTVDQTATFTASHEIIEAATDPYVGTNPQQLGFELSNPIDRATWSFFGGEVGDLCVDLMAEIGLATIPGDQATEAGYLVQRTWSNKSAKASHNPCVPIPAGEVYFNTPPADAAEQTTVAVGSKVTIELDAFSDAPTNDWTLRFFDMAQLEGHTPVLTFSADKQKVNNGQKVQLTIGLVSSPLFQDPFTGASFEPYLVVSQSADGRAYAWPALITGQ